MREILFKAKRADNGKWVEGFYYEHQPPLQCFAGENTEKSKHYILQTGFADWGMPRKIDLIEVVHETVCQYTGLQDKDDKNIFEGDIFWDSNWETEFEIKWENTLAWMAVERQTGWEDFFPDIWDDKCTVIGNIHDGSGNSEPDN